MRTARRPLKVDQTTYASLEGNQRRNYSQIRAAASGLCDTLDVPEHGDSIEARWLAETYGRLVNYDGHWVM
jgi:hypothetical protein